MPINDYLKVFLDAGITNRRDQESYTRRLDALVAQESLSAAELVGVGEKGTSGSLDLYVIGRRALYVASERGMFTKRIELRTVGPVAAIARLRGTQEGFKGHDLTIPRTTRAAANCSRSSGASAARTGSRA